MLEKRESPVTLELPPEPVRVSADMVRLSQVLCNLLINAAKFTPPCGLIALRVSAADGWVEIAIEDSCGSTFTVRLPTIDRVAAGSRSSPLPAEARHVAGGPRILIVDDNADAAETLALLLESAGYDVRTAADGGCALALLDEFTPALAILDIGLPGMDGYELARRLRADPRISHLRLIALTGYGREPDRARALAADFEEHLVKPVRPDLLLDAVTQLMDRAPDVQV
ncbi:MAG: response regulator [Betaproteobacteria bacterium]